MEVHPPVHPVMTWKQFFVHMTIVVLGLLIAITLEQSVEALHRRHERKELREGLQRDLEQVQNDSGDGFYWLTEREERTEQYTHNLQDALNHGVRPKPVVVKRSGHQLNSVSDATFSASKANGTLSLLPTVDVVAFSELDFLIQTFDLKIQNFIATEERVKAMFTRYGQPERENSTWNKATLEEKHTLIALLSEGCEQYDTAADLLLEIDGAAKAIQHGERDLRKLYEAEWAAERAGVKAFAESSR